VCTRRKLTVRDPSQSLVDGGSGRRLFRKLILCTHPYGKFPRMVIVRKDLPRVDVSAPVFGIALAAVLEA
jgi:hypothetical protein